jgi:hypothetical protein
MSYKGRLEKLIKSSNGTSLIEFLLYLALLSIILLVAVDLMLKTGEFGARAGSQTNIQRDAARILSRFAFDIRRASAITLPASLGQTSTSLELTVEGETHTYQLSGNNLDYQREVFLPTPSTQSANLNSNLTKINSISFQRLGGGSGKPTVKIIFEIEDQKGSKGGPILKTFETVLVLR